MPIRPRRGALRAPSPSRSSISVRTPFVSWSTNGTRVVTTDGEALIRKSLKELVDELDPQQFWQIHRSTLVNVAAIAGVTRDFRGRMLVKLKKRDDTLLVSDTYTHLFRQM